MSSETPFTRENLDFYLKELGREFRKLGGKNMPSEIVLVGGAAILANYGFRDMTYDMDAIISASSAMKDAINHVGDKFGLPNGWLNTDFKKTESFTPKLIEFSVYYRTFFGLQVRTVAAEYLIAMKLKAGRPYKNDLSDVVGIISEHRAKGKHMAYEQIDDAVCKLYGSWDGISADLKEFVVSVLKQPDLTAFYKQYRESESQNKAIILEHQRKYPDAIKDKADINAIIEKAKRKMRSRNEPER